MELLWWPLYGGLHEEAWNRNKDFLEAKIVSFDNMLNKIEKIKNRCRSKSIKKEKQENTMNHVVRSWQPTFKEETLKGYIFDLCVKYKSYVTMKPI